MYSHMTRVRRKKPFTRILVEKNKTEWGNFTLVCDFAANCAIPIKKIDSGSFFVSPRSLWLNGMPFPSFWIEWDKLM